MLPRCIVNQKFAKVVFPNEEGNWTLYFSYQSLIAFQTADGKVFKRRNTWGPTTGRHLSSIPHGTTLDTEDFEAAYQEHSRRHTVPA